MEGQQLHYTSYVKEKVITISLHLLFVSDPQAIDLLDREDANGYTALMHTIEMRNTNGLMTIIKRGASVFKQINNKQSIRLFICSKATPFFGEDDLLTCKNQQKTHTKKQRNNNTQCPTIVIFPLH